jgi:hypothetical protein
LKVYLKTSHHFNFERVLLKIQGAASKRNLEAFLEKTMHFLPFSPRQAMINCQFVGVNSSDNFSRNLLVPISIHNDIRNSWLALVKMEENAQFFPSKLPNLFCLQHPEFSTKLAQNRNDAKF